MDKQPATYRPMGYMDYIHDVSLGGCRLVVRKTETYGDSWKRRGGAGAWFTTVRPWDRLEGIVTKFKGDILEACLTDTTGADGSALACVRDIRNYLTLIEAEVVSIALSRGDPMMLADGSPPGLLTVSIPSDLDLTGLSTVVGTGQITRIGAASPVEDHTEIPKRGPYPTGTPERARAVEGLERLLRDMLTVAGLGDAVLSHVPDGRLNGTVVSINITIPI